MWGVCHAADKKRCGSPSGRGSSSLPAQHSSRGAAGETSGRQENLQRPLSCRMASMAGRLHPSTTPPSALGYAPSSPASPSPQGSTSELVLCCLLLFSPFCLRRLRGNRCKDLPGRCVLYACAQRPASLPPSGV